MADVRGLGARTIGSRITNCRRVEKFEGDLDSLYDFDRLADLLGKLTYSAQDERNGKQPRHKIPINGDQRTGTATLKAAVELYLEFRDSISVVREAVRKRGRSLPRRRTRSTNWPNWSQPSEHALHELAEVLAPLVRFLAPEIVTAVVEDNQRHHEDWSARFRALGIDPAIYLWNGSPCAFPGVRRHAGSKEIAEFSGQSTTGHAPPQCLVIDDNDYPKHLWAFVLTGTPFRKIGPKGYQLGHLVDHKEHGNRWREELDGFDGTEQAPTLFGLFTSASNAAYFPTAFLRPTDFSLPLRSLIQRQARRLYSGICRILPPPLEPRPFDNPAWDPARFSWADPVGEATNVKDFLDFRRERIDHLFARRRAISQEPA